MILYWNCCGGIKGKMPTVEYILKNYNPEIMYISEAEYESNQTFVNFEGYDLYCSQTISFGKSRLISLVKKGTNFSPRSIIANDIELICLESNDTVVAGLYRPFTHVNGNTAMSYLNKMYIELEKLSRVTKKIIVVGDFNINYNVQSKEKDDLEMWALKFSLEQKIQENTWERIVTVDNVKHLKTSRIDLCFTNFEATVSVEDRFTSDHALIMIQAGPNTTKVVRSKHIRRDWRKYSPITFSTDIERLLANAPVEISTQKLEENITKAVKDTMEAYCPNRVIRTNRPDDVIDQCLEKMKKKRKRLKKEYNVSRNQHLLDIIDFLNVKIKKRIVTVKKKQLETRLNSKNPKSFWKAVATLEGKYEEEEIKLDGLVDQKEIAEKFATFFVEKVEKLSKNEGSLDYTFSKSTLRFSREEVVSAAKKLKSKMCKGEDEIPLKVIKDVAVLKPDLFTNLFNKIPVDGIPVKWKTAIITPIHKSGSKTKVEQYRPVSNLNSLSKLFEKVVLSKLEGIDDGDFQHGFKKGRNTTTAALELQDFISSELDKGKVVGTYSLDLSAAFDLLRPNQFKTMLEYKIPKDLLPIIMDFMSFRNFKVQIGTQRSEARFIKVGCVQGSILGPKLFTLYMSHLESAMKPGSHLVAYADDAYVSVAESTHEEVKTKLEEQLETHENFLETIGMVTNTSKTELIYFSRKPIMDPPSLNVKGISIQPSKTIKVLGLMFQDDLKEEAQLARTLKSCKFLVPKLKFLGRFLSKEHLKTVITAQFFSRLYYGCETWLHEISSARTWKMLNSLHYRVLRVILKDYNNTISRSEIDRVIKRATPRQWSYYTTSKLAINLMNGTTPLGRKLKSKCYVNDRNPGRGTISDTSRLKIGRFSLANRLQCLRRLNFDWCTGISKDLLRINLKKCFIT